MHVLALVFLWIAAVLAGLVRVYRCRGWSWTLDALTVRSMQALSVLVYGYRPLWRLRLRSIPGPKPEWLYGNCRHAAVSLWPGAVHNLL